MTRDEDDSTTPAPASSSFTLHPSSFIPIAIIGAGPTGLAATIRLLELGYLVHLYERSHHLGGVPARLLAPLRAVPDPQPEIDSILAPALTAGRLKIHFGSTLGEDLSLEALAHAGCAAILVTTGLWEESSLGLVPGVMGALAFLESSAMPVPDRVAILAGGDSAMDAARAAQARGAKELYIIFGGPRSALHWHLPESWFATPGVSAMMQWQPLGYDTGPDARVSAVRLRHSELHTEATLPVDLVIEAMALQPSAQVQSAIAAYEAASTAGSKSTRRPRIYPAGALVNGGTSVGHCVAEGLAAAEAIHRDLCSPS
jgi:NADPH-dependent glutamate synthase beta subunit-like oxidoreductase